MTDALLDTIPCGVVTFSDEGIITFANDTLRAMLGYDDGRELCGLHVERLLTIAGRIFYQTHFFPLLRLHGRASEIFLLVQRRDGEVLGTLVNGVRRERDGVMVNDCVVMEVRERRKYEDELLAARRMADGANAELETRQQELSELATELEFQSEALQAANEELMRRSAELDVARAAAEEANTAKSAFLATMSHELRTPLNAIGGYTELLALGVRGPVNAAQADDLARIRRANQHLMGLVNDILTFARVEAGHVEFNLTPLSLESVVADVEPLVAPQVAAKGLALQVAGDATRGGPTVVFADAEKLRQVLLNLLTNAEKFTDAGGRIEIAWARDMRAGTATLRVRDTGRGIPADRLQRIFDPFVQIDRHRTPTGQQGVGLGLAISRDLVRGMGGDIVVESEEGQGSTFVVVLPLATG